MRLNAHGALDSHSLVAGGLLLYSGISVAPLWDFCKGHFVGVLSASDFILILREVRKKLISIAYNLPFAEIMADREVNTNGKNKMVSGNRFNDWESSGVKIVPVLSQPDKTWTGEIGYVQATFSRAKGIVNPTSTSVVLCGQKQMAELRNHESNLTEKELETHTILAWKDGKSHIIRQIDSDGGLYPRRLIHIKGVYQRVVSCDTTFFFMGTSANFTSGSAN
ncbi:hypothetical protein Dimus_021008 [Dionaea muscipula]